MNTRMNTLDFAVRGEFVELCQLLKLTGLANSGGQGQLMVADGQVKVDGQPESRKRAKIRAGQVVECFDTRIRIIAGEQG